MTFGKRITEYPVGTVAICQYDTFTQAGVEIRTEEGWAAAGIDPDTGEWRPWCHHDGEGPCVLQVLQYGDQARRIADLEEAIDSFRHIDRSGRHDIADLEQLNTAIDRCLAVSEQAR